MTSVSPCHAGRRPLHWQVYNSITWSYPCVLSLRSPPCSPSRWHLYSESCLNLFCICTAVLGLEWVVFCKLDFDEIPSGYLLAVAQWLVFSSSRLCLLSFSRVSCRSSLLHFNVSGCIRSRLLHYSQCWCWKMECLSKLNFQEYKPCGGQFAFLRPSQGSFFLKLQFFLTCF